MKITLLVSAFLISCFAFSAPGDDCATSILVSSNACSTASQYSNAGITGTVIPTCFGTVTGSSHSMWFSFLATAPTVNITVTGSSLTQTMVALLGSPPTPPCTGAFPELACSNPATGAVSTVTYSALTVGGFYDSTLEFGEKDIELFLMFRKEDEKVLLDDLDVHVMINELFKTLVHEKKHRYQFKKRGRAYGPRYCCRKKIADEQLLKELEYYGDPDEIDAYAQEAIIELRLTGTSDTQQKYKELFDKHDKKVYNSFLKKFYKYNNKITL